MFPLVDSVARRHTPFMVMALIALNVLVFIWEAGLPQEWIEYFSYHLGLVPARYTLPEWAIRHGMDPRNLMPFISAQFMHGSLAHIVGNMWTLWIFGPALEDRMGPFRFLLFYMLTGLAAMVTHTALNPYSTLPAIGASGAIAGVIGGYTLLFPRSRVLFMIPIFIFPFFFEWPAILYGVIWFLIQLLQGTQALGQFNLGGGVAWWAHVGGFVFGILLAKLFASPSQRHRVYYLDEGKLGYSPDGRQSNTSARYTRNLP